MTVIGTAASMGLAQTPADSGAEPQPSAAEPVAAQDAAPQADSEPTPPAWNRRRTAPGGVDGQLRRLTVDLKLDAGQQAKIRPILVARTEQIQSLQRDSALAPAERQRRIVAVGDRSVDEIRAQLNDAQREQYVPPRAATVVAQAPPAAKRSAAAASAPVASKAAKR